MQHSRSMINFWLWVWESFW